MSDRAILPKLLRLALPALVTVLAGILVPAAAAKPQRHGHSQSPDTARSQADLAADNSAEPPQQLADRVVVRKSERRLYLMHHGAVLRSYRVALGENPVGPKEQEGDSRTPEGHYALTRRNPRSEYFLSIQVSYPNDRDMQRARRNRLTPGGAIMIHGLPNELRRRALVLRAAGLDRRLHRGVRLRHAGDLAADAAGHAHRHPSLGAPHARRHRVALGPSRHFQSSIVNTSSIIIPESVDALVGPRGSLENLSQEEIDETAGHQPQRHLRPVPQVRPGGAQHRQRHR